jgi:hypothetical protein
MASDTALSERTQIPPHPWPIEAFLAAHPRAMKFV